MKNNFLAKTNPVETIKEHTMNLVIQKNKLKKLYPNIKNLNWDILNYACIFHDFGKMNCQFQNKLITKLIKVGDFNEEDYIKNPHPKVEEIPHGYISCAFVPEDFIYDNYGEDELKILYQSIYYHHNRPELKAEDELCETINEDISRFEKEFVKIMEEHFDFEYEGLKNDYLEYIQSNERIIEEDGDVFLKYIITKGLLNKLDYAASAHIDVEVENKGLFQKTDGYLKSGGFKPNELQQYMINNRDKNIVAIASTGIGKTEAALYWIGNDKGFFTLPLRVSINAIYDRTINKIGFTETALLHSDTYSEYLKRNNNKINIDYYDKTKQLSMPLTICTLDQLIDFVFKYEGFELKLATLAYSRLVIDEIQMYSPEFIGYLIVAIYYIHKMGGKFSIVTATLPEVITHFMEALNIPFVKPDPFVKKDENGNEMLRHKVTTIKEQINIEHIKENYKDRKVLVIVNTVGKAQEIYEELTNSELDCDINLFHSRFIKMHRSDKESAILEMGDKDCKKTGIWVTTQVVEASLDIDFDVLYTELSDISGLFQRMGRVYRNRLFNKNQDTNIYVYAYDEKPSSGIGKGDKSIVDIEIFNLSKKAIMNFKDKQLNEREKMELVEKVYSVKNLKGTNYYDTIKTTINWAMDIPERELKKNEERLRDISNVTIIPKSIYDLNRQEIEDNLEIIEEEISKGTSKEKILEIKNRKQIAKNDIRKFTVDISEKAFQKAYKANKYISELEISKYNVIPIVNLEYSMEKGLDIRNIKDDNIDDRIC